MIYDSDPALNLGDGLHVFCQVEREFVKTEEVLNYLGPLIGTYDPGIIVNPCRSKV